MAKASTTETDQPIADGIKEVEEQLKKIGLSKLQEIARQQRVKWMETEIKIGVTGQAGVGKSTFINTYRGIKPGQQTDAKVATVGERHTTLEATPYPDPINSKIQLFDLPGLGAPGFRKKNYLSHEDVRLQEYDFIIIITSERFREDDIWLYNKICHEMQKSVFLVRNKVMVNIEVKMERTKMTENDALAEMRKDCKEELQEHIKEYNEDEGTDYNDNIEIYFIDCHQKDHKQLDFSRLLIAFAKSMPNEKHDAVLFNLRHRTPKILEEKYNALWRRMFLTCTISSLGAMVPIPGTSMVLDVMLIKQEVDEYRRQFGIDDIFIPNSMDPIIQGIQRFWASFNMLSLAEIVVSEGVEKSASLIPIVGTMIAAITSFGSTLFVLRKLLNKMYEDAKKIHEIQQ